MQVDNVATIADVPDRPARARWFGRFAAFLLAYLLFVILFGAWVRITGSGAGCGDHWPTCGGAFVPRAPSVQTLIEYSHRITSGLLGLMALALPLWALRVHAPGHPARFFSLATFVLVVVEAGIGAGLVLKQLVASDASAARAVAVALHLTNTLLLTGAATLTVAYATDSDYPRKTARFQRPAIGPWLPALLIGLIAIAASGAITALGDTLFPVHATGDRAAPPDHFLVELRILHPIAACLIVCASILTGLHYSRSPTCRRPALALVALSGAELAIGALNIALRAPGWLQLIHLLGAQLTWMSAVLLLQAVRDAPARAEANA